MDIDPKETNLGADGQGRRLPKAEDPWISSMQYEKPVLRTAANSLLQLCSSFEVVWGPHKMFRLVLVHFCRRAEMFAEMMLA